MSIADGLTPQERVRCVQLVVDLVLETGVSATSAAERIAKDWGVTRQDIFKWAEEMGRTFIEGDYADPQKIGERARVRAHERRVLEAVEAQRAAADARKAMGVAMREGHGRDAKEFAIAYGILIDKAQLLAGEVTARLAQVTDDPVERAQLLAETKRLRDEVAEARTRRERRASSE